MNVRKLSDIEYKYLLDTDELREARDLSDKRNNIIQKSPYFTDNVKQKINAMSHDLASIMESVINRESIDSIDDYSDALDALALANADIQIEISESTRDEKFGKFKKSHPLYKDFLKWQQIQNHIGSSEWSYLVKQNHKTALCDISLWFAAFLIPLIGITSGNVIGLTCSVIGFVLVVLFLLALSVIFNTQMERNYYIDQLHRIKNYTMSRSKKTLKSRNSNLFHLLSFIRK